ncbi:hypothetical protein CHLNCDRAFT_31694 [Chlorella variabilis]|uniref:3'(2'),5'-bisphosphate nucleotidase n=1 Tax=Chlorella variabilis TaxID=554065 RepID=E1ZIB9_CHLVA|nr:hypothetical protein CHLNCDRAFT_31694 [Chlorella variabilis]EFN54129.1 hypothetical protein CHLNCDRAFT_31694 [Chlorella variabilis]|eukprot:XP_005846231.1 hypothetical protein CHLNCDRAFT_31694 [Chlorella variabilis]
MSSTLAASRGTHAGGAAQAGLRRGSSVLPVLPWSGSVLKQPKQQQPQQRRTAAAALSGRRQRRAVRAVAAPLAPEVSASEHTVELHAAVEAVRLASRLCQAVQVELKTGEKVEKEDESPVTVADYGAQALVAWSLQHAFPGQPLSMVAEEDAIDLRTAEGAVMLARITALVNEALAVEHPQVAPLTPGEVADLVDSGSSQGGGQGRHWVLDPIDGTRGFVGMRQYAVCLGLLQEGEVVLGVLGCPNLPQYAITADDCDEGQAARSFSDEAVGTMFAASKGQGAYAGPVFGGMPRQRIFCNDILAPGEARYMESFEARHSNHGLAMQIADEIGVELPSLRLDSQAKYGALSRGDASIFMRFPDASYREKIWDHCAGVAIIEEAGAVISDALGNPLDFSQGRFFPDLNGGIVAATPSMHRAIMAAIRKIRGLPPREQQAEQ